MSPKPFLSYLLFSIFTILVVTTICSVQATSPLWSSNLTGTDWDISNTGGGHFLNFLAISDDGKTIAAATADGSIYLIDDAGTIFRNITAGNKTSEILSLSLSPDGNYLAFSNAGSSPASNPPKRISLLDRSGEELWNHSTRTFVFHSAASSNGLFSVFGSYENITSIDKNGSVLWNYPAASPVISLDISDDGEYIVAATENGELQCLNRSGSVLWENKFRSPSDVKISSDGNYVCLTTYLRQVFFMDTKGNILWNRTLPPGTKFAECGISNNGEKIVVRSTGAVSGYGRSGTQMWNYSTDYLQPLTHPISAPVFSLSGDGRYSVVAAGDFIIILDDKGNETGTFSFDDKISGVAISSGGTKIAAITSNELYYFDNRDAGSNDAAAPSSCTGQTGYADHETGIDEAEESLRTFLSSIDNERSYTNAKIISPGDFTTSAGDYYEFETDVGNFKVYKKTGEVESAWFYQDDSGSGRSDLSKDWSLKLAKEFAQEHYPAFDNLNMVLTGSEKSEGNDGRTRYLFKWYEVENSLFGTEVYTFNYVIIAVEGGEIAGYIGVERETEVSLSPEISESEAMEKAVYALDLPVDSGRNYEYDNKLCVSYFDGKQHLAWYINIDNGVDSWGYASGGQAVIDAQNGDVLLKNPYM